MSGNGWIGVDLDGTLAFYDAWRGPEHIGAPIPAMQKRVKQWLAEGKEVRIMTARADPAWPLYGVAVTTIENWCRRHLGEVLRVTNQKDFDMIELWDDRAIQVEHNTGIPIELR